MDDFRAVIRSAPDPYLLITADLTILEASDAYLSSTMTERDTLLGRTVLELFPDNPADQAVDGVASVRASFARVLEERRPHSMPTLRRPIRQPSGELVERHWRVLNSPILDEQGGVRYILHRAEDVTESLRLESEREELGRTLHRIEVQARRYQDLIDQAPDAMVIVDNESRILLINRQTEQLFGYTREELIGHSLEMLIPERFRSNHGGHVSRFFASPVSRPMGSRLELHGRRKDATELQIEVSLSPQRDDDQVTVSASIRDVSERRGFEAAARLAGERLRSAVEATQDAFALFDADDRLIMCNSVFRRLAHAAEPETLVGKSYTQVLDAWIGEVEFPDAASRERFRQDRVSRRSLEPSTTFDVRLRDGRSLRFADRRTAEGGIVKTIWDITEDERRAEELREARSAAESASEAKSDFLSSMSHELRTPLNAVLGFAQLLLRDRREPLSQRHRERVEHVLRSGEHLLRLIEDILDLSKIEAGHVSLSLEPVGVSDVLREIANTLEPIAARQNITLEVLPVQAVLPAVVADRTRFAQILMNFGSNAVKYNRPEGRVSISVSRPSEATIRVTVADTGMGIPIEQQDKLFQPFQRAGQEAGPIEGTGIGLMITKRLAELMHGTVGFRSVADQGSEFWIELPVPSNDEAFNAPAATASRDPQLRRAPGQRLVLCVEDNPANIVFMRDLMSTLDDIELVTVPTAELGIELARARHFDLVLMDINLPGMSGLDALRVLKGDETTRSIPVIALTAAASDRDRHRGVEAGFYRYLSKPANVDELIDAIDSALRTNR